MALFRWCLDHLHLFPVVRKFPPVADETALYLRLLEKHFGVSIRRIAIDAPSDPRPDCLRRRLAETAMDKQHISCFATPSVSEFEAIRVKVHDYLR
jgi:hypothetical protein